MYSDQSFNQLHPAQEAHTHSRISDTPGFIHGSFCVLNHFCWCTGLYHSRWWQ